MNSIISCEWDTQAFGFPVARIPGRIDSDEVLVGVLERARKSSVRLVFWIAEARYTPSNEILQTYGGARIVGFRDYERRFSGLAEPNPQRFRIVSVRGQAPSAALYALSREAGHLSRYRLDERLPRKVFESLYDTWLARSLSGVMADEVLVALGDAPEPLGFVSAKLVDGQTGRIGLIATASAARGAGVGRSLLEAVHVWAGHSGVDLIQVSTQTENATACRLYERCGYGIAAEGHHYHFLLPD